MWSALILAVLALGAPAEDDGPIPPPPSPPMIGVIDESLPAPEDLRIAFDKLEPQAQHDIVEWYRHEMSRRWTLQMSFVRHVVETQSREIDPGTWPTLEPPPYYDPVVHAPGQVIPRDRLDVDSRRAQQTHQRMFSSVPERRIQSGWVYDWGSGELRRLRDGRDVERAFENALQGLPPDIDLAEALLERWLDDGTERDGLAAFGHAYTDREGNAYPDVSLYDAWASGESFEMPDVDVLGLIHDLEDEWKKWTAPISPYRARKLYEVVENDLFLPVHHHRGLRTALARTYLVGDAVLRDGYGANLERFHALWEFHGASPSTLLGELPQSGGWEEFLKNWLRKCKRDEDLAASGRNRRWALRTDAREGYKALALVMQRAETP